jgi:hypothetical protein
MCKQDSLLNGDEIMPKRKKYDFDNPQFVDNELVPSGRIRKNRWEHLFERIPVGKSLIMREGEISFQAVRSALYDLQRKGKFKHLRARKVREADGTYTYYVVNTAEEKRSSAS